MTRHTRRCWRRTATHAVIAVLAASDAAIVAAMALRDRSGATLAAAVGIGYVSVVALCAALSWSWAAGRSSARDWRIGRRLAAVARLEAPTAGRHAAAMAAVAADAPLPQRSAGPETVAYTAVLPTVVAATPGAAVTHAAQQPWAPPVSEPASAYLAEARQSAAYAAGETGATGRHARWAA